MRSLVDLTTLQENWNSYGGAEINHEAISNAAAIIAKLHKFGVDEEMFAVAAEPNGENISEEDIKKIAERFK